MPKSHRATLLNAFTPSHEITDPKLFAGRHEQVRELTDSLHTAAEIPLIYGDRGLGKSSLAIQMQWIAMGATELLDSMGAHDHAIDQEDAFMVFYATCSDEIRNDADLLQLLINCMEEVDLESKTRKVSKLVDRKTRKQLSFKVVQLESTKTYQQEAARIKHEKLNQSEKLLGLVRAMMDSVGQRRILFVIDELDRVADLSGFASFLHNSSSPELRFALVGAAQSVADLHLSHHSIDRHLAPVQVTRMSNGELADVIDRALHSLRAQGLNYKFAPDARTRLVRTAVGFPWFVHVIGQQSLLAAYEQGSATVSNENITQAIRKLTDKRFAQQFADSYQHAVRDSITREKVLRLLAAWPGEDIPTGDAYAILRSCGVSKPSTYVKQLKSYEYGEVLTSPGYQRSSLIRFKNEMFRQYAYLRPPIHDPVDVDAIENAIASYSRRG
ncbi:ATP-binding protein [Streptomyces sp. NRRL S-1022]|uniref:ATP-binding protein n=1 Tax=Streptomyces sp. NRRL S-1022 TaxID=1463880 RepID=UPI00131AA06B|nr:ATP-binding protein [Streptomyces sp. NRRL S-1022]